MPVKTRLKVRFNHANAVGVMFYGNLYLLAHQAFEKFLTAAGFGFDEWFDNPNWVVPYRRIEADYYKPLRPGRDIDGHFYLERIGETSFTSRVRFFDDAGEVAAEILFVSVFTDAGTQATIPVPDDVRPRLERFVEAVPPREEAR